MGFWHNFDNGSGYIPLAQTPEEWDVVNVSFAIEADPGHGESGRVAFVPELETEAQIKAGVAALQAKGKIVNISIGGQNGRIELHTTEARDNFVQTLGDIIANYGFNGLDIDLEGAPFTLSATDTIANPTSPGIVNMIDAVKSLKARFGKDFVLTMAPEIAYVYDGYAYFGGTTGAYLPVIHGLRDELNLLHVQHYNNHGGNMDTPSGQVRNYSLDAQVAMVDMLITGFNAPSSNPNNHFPGLRADQVGFGVPSGSKAAGQGQVSNQLIQDAISCLTQHINCGSVVPSQMHKDFGGLMTWSINWDAHDGYIFSKPNKAFLDNLPK